MKKRFISILFVLCMLLILLPTTVQASLPNNGVKLKEGWYNLRCMGNYLNLDATGNAELRDKTKDPEGNAKFYARFDGNLLLETEDGRYLGLETLKIKNGLRVKAVENLSGNMVHWDLYNEDKTSKDIWSLRPRMEIDYLLNASGQKNADGTPIIIWEHIDKWRCPSAPVPDSPNHGEFRFIPTTGPAGAMVPGTPKTPVDGWYSLRFDTAAANNIIDVIRADLVELNSWSCAMPWTRAFYVENKGNNQITLKLADGRYLGVGTDAVSDYGWKVATVKSPFLWNTYSESLGVGNSHRKYSLRAASDTDLILRAYTVNYSLGDPITVFKSKGAYGRSEVVFWELKNDEIPEAKDKAPVPSQKPATSPGGLTATPSKTSFVMNGQTVSVTAAYNINGTNYLQLRAIAALLSGTTAQFNIGWDGQYAVIEPGVPYKGNLILSQLQNTMNIRPSGTKINLNGKIFTFADARLIGGDTNYLQLREFAQKLSGTASQFNVYWDKTLGQAVIQPGVAYTGSAS